MKELPLTERCLHQTTESRANYQAVWRAISSRTQSCQLVPPPQLTMSSFFHLSQTLLPQDPDQAEAGPWHSTVMYHLNSRTQITNSLLKLLFLGFVATALRKVTNTLSIRELTSSVSFVVLASFMSTQHKTESFGKREPQLIKCHHQIDLQGSLWVILF